MISQQPLTNDDARLLQILDVETVCEKKPDSAVTSGFSIIPWHDLTTLFRLLRKIAFMPFQTSIFYIEMVGIERNSSEEMKLVYIGDKSSYEYIVSFVFSTKAKVHCQRHIPWWTVKRQVINARLNADLLICDIDFPLDLLINKQGALVSPRWVKQKIVIADKWVDLLANLRRKTRREAQRSIRKYNLNARVVRDADSDRFFYHQLYKPYIRRRYGTQAMLVDEQRFLKECASGRLIQVMQNDKVLGTVLVHISGKQLTIAWMGIDKNVEDSQLKGVTDALDLYSLMFAYTQGCDVMDMGGSRPLIKDGVLRYKKKWGSAVSQGLIPKGSIFYIPCRITQPVKSFLENNPMILNEGKKLRCVSWIFSEENIVTGTDNMDHYTTMFNNMHQPGLDEFQCFRIIDEGRQEEFNGIVAGLPYRISFIPSNRVLTALSDFSS